MARRTQEKRQDHGYAAWEKEPYYMENKPMMHKGNGYFANMPTEPKMHEYPKQAFAMPGEQLDDTIRGIDENDRSADKLVKDHFSDSMY